MKRLVLIFFMLSVVVSLSAGKHKMRLMTYNVPYGNIDPVGVNTWEYRRDALVDLIQEANPDLIGMQEPTRTCLLTYVPLLKGYSMLGIARDGYDSGQFTLILYKTNRFVVEHMGNYFLSKTPEVVSKDWASECHRLATWAVFRDKQSGARFLYTNTHLDHISDSARINQMMVIKTFMKKQIVEYGNMPMMITGDFNTLTSGGAYDRACNYLIPMQDAWVVASKKVGNSTTFPAEPSLGSTPRKIDYIIISKDVKVETAVIKKSWRPNGTIISDHNPHYADLMWETKTTEDYEQLLRDAQKSVDSTYTYRQGTVPLIKNTAEGTEDCQLSYDTKEGTIQLKNLVDGSCTTYFRSSWSGVNPYNPHYLQVDLRRDDVDKFHFSYAPNVSEDGQKDHWEDVRIMASNDLKTWDYIDELHDIPLMLQVSHMRTINMHKPYRHVRLEIMRTPSMRMRNGFAQYQVSELQLYKDIIDENNSEACFNPQVKQAVENVNQSIVVLNQLMSEGGGEISEAAQSLQDALQYLRRIKKDDSKLRSLLSEAAELMNNFTPGSSKLGHVDRNTYNTLSTLCDKLNNQLYIVKTKTEIDSCTDILAQAIDKFKQARISLQSNHWYYITNGELNGTVRGDNYGQAIYLSGNSSRESVLRTGYYQFKKQKWDCLQNPYAMWRFIPQGEDKYAIQNRATGMYMGLYNDTAFFASTTPIAYEVTLEGVEDLHIMSEQGPERYYFTVNSNASVGVSKKEAHSRNSWTVRDVNDSEIGTIQIPVKNHSFSIMSLPYAVKNIKTFSPELTTYKLCGSTSTGVLSLKAKDSFEAGEAFFVIAGKIEDLQVGCTEEVYLECAPPDTFTSEKLLTNGLQSVLYADETVSGTSYYVTDNQLRLGSGAHISTMSGYAVRNKINNLGETPDVTVTRNGGITKILPVCVDKDENACQEMYNLNGQKITSDTKVLPFGIYIKKGNKYFKK